MHLVGSMLRKNQKVYPGRDIANIENNEWPGSKTKGVEIKNVETSKRFRKEAIKLNRSKGRKMKAGMINFKNLFIAGTSISLLWSIIKNKIHLHKTLTELPIDRL